MGLVERLNVEADRRERAAARRERLNAAFNLAVIAVAGGALIVTLLIAPGVCGRAQMEIEALTISE